MMHERETASQRCPKCNRSFTVLADEYGDHDCPYCGFSAREPEEDDNDSGMTLDCGCCACCGCDCAEDDEEDAE